MSFSLQKRLEPIRASTGSGRWAPKGFAGQRSAVSRIQCREQDSMHWCSRAAKGYGWSLGSGLGSSGLPHPHSTEPTHSWSQGCPSSAPLVWLKALDGPPPNQDPGPGVRYGAASPL